MIVSFFESVKYTGYLAPLAFFRVYLALNFFLRSALDKLELGFLDRPQLPSMIQSYLPSSSAPDWYKTFLETVVVPHWSLFSYTIIYCEFVIAVALFFGFLIRPVSILAIFLCLNYIYITDVSTSNLYQMMVAVFVTLAWLGAGRCLGMDYFFFKRNRGIWW